MHKLKVEIFCVLLIALKVISDIIKLLKNFAKNKVADPYGEMKYPCLMVDLKEKLPYISTYTVNNWTGPVVDLVSILVSAGIGVADAVSGFLPNFLATLGVTVVSGVIKSALTTTVASEKTDYTWQIYDSVYNAKSYVTGQRNIISDSGNHYGEVYYDGVTPNAWGSNQMAAIFYDRIYSYTSSYVNDWIRTDDSGYI